MLYITNSHCRILRTSNVHLPYARQLLITDNADRGDEVRDDEREYSIFDVTACNKIIVSVSRVIK